MEIFKYSNDALDHLLKKDKKLGQAIDRIGIVEREVIPDLFTALVNSIVSQQISAKAASTVWGRLLNTLSEISPQNICFSPLEDLRKCGLSMRKVQYIKNIGETVLNNDLVLTDLYALEDEEIIKRSHSLTGYWQMDSRRCF
jgi:DNA-3-methyladenine glycosylase II